MLPKFQKLYDEISQEFLIGGLADGMSLEDLAKKHDVDVKIIDAQFKMGVEVEMEHTEDPDVASEIARDHLFEDPLYYDKLAAMEDGKCDAQITSED